MIAALNEWRRANGLPTLPTLTGRRSASRRLRRWWMYEFVHCYECHLPVTPSRARFAFSRAGMSPEKMDHACAVARIGWDAEVTTWGAL